MVDRGRVHSFETFGTVDGPGIRFVIFFRGCNLRCVYCHNPDTWDQQGGELTEVKEIVDKLKKFLPYMIASGGGVTVSGGEPLLQLEFLTEIFKECKKLGLHTAVDTNGCIEIPESGDFADNHLLSNFLRLTDLVLLDIKHMNPEMHKKLTGVSNENTLSFAKYLNKLDIPVWIRNVIVPGYSDDVENIIQLKEFINTLSNVKKVEFIAFHKMGEYKWEKLGYPYSLKDVSIPSEDDLDRIKKIFGMQYEKSEIKL